MNKGLPQNEVFEDHFWDGDLAFEASSGLEFTEAAEKMSSCVEDISDVVEATDNGFELGSGDFSLGNQIGDGVDPGECFVVREANYQAACVVNPSQNLFSLFWTAFVN